MQNNNDDENHFTPKDEYRFRKRVFMERRNEFDNWDYLKHHNHDKQWFPKQSTTETKFIRGFNRKQKNSIPFNEEKLSYLEIKHKRAELNRTYRSKQLSLQDQRTQYNPITGVIHEGKKTKEWVPNRKFIGDTKSNLLERETGIRLRCSPYRFYGGLSNSSSTALRESTLTNEGLDPNTKFSSILGIGRSEMNSCGVSDNFGKSIYHRELAPGSSDSTSRNNILRNTGSLVSSRNPSSRRVLTSRETKARTEDIASVQALN